LLTLKTQYCCISTSLSSFKIVSPVFPYTNSPPPLPPAVSSLSVLRSCWSSYPSIAKKALLISLLHQLSVTKIMSGSVMLATHLSSSTFFTTLCAFKYSTFSVFVVARPRPLRSSSCCSPSLHGLSLSPSPLPPLPRSPSPLPPS